MTKLSPEWVRTSDPVIRSPARYRWTNPPPPLMEKACCSCDNYKKLPNVLKLLYKEHLKIFVGIEEI